MNIAFPDWPDFGPVDLAKHDLPHASSSTEWWYLHAHIETSTGGAFSLFAAFFRILKPGEPDDVPDYAHSVTWALTDVQGDTYYPESRVDPCAPELGAKKIRNGMGSKDSRVNRAMLEVLEAGVVPLPDRVIAGEVRVLTDTLLLDYGGLIFEKIEEGSYRLCLHNLHDGVGCELVFRLKKKPVRQGDGGVVKGPGGEDMFYYFVPRCDVTGVVTIGEVSYAVKGSGWYDHEFGAVPPQNDRVSSFVQDTVMESQAQKTDIAWNWVGIQLSDGSELSAYSLVHADDMSCAGQRVVVVEASEIVRNFSEMKLSPLRTWRSKRTFREYPTGWTLDVPQADLHLELDAACEDQEFMTVISQPAFWEGRIHVRGTRNGVAVSGCGYLERSGFEPITDLDEFFNAVGEEVRKSVAEVLPLDPTWEQVCGLIGGEEHRHYMDGVDISRIVRSLITPVREIADRVGKSWRSYAAMACCDVVQGDSRRYVQWLAIPELIHVGSLMVDDVQDKSSVRRGKPAAHVIYDEARVINAGTYAYFLAQKGIIAIDVTPEQRMRIYNLYFEVMRAGHAGQALDLDGPVELMSAAVASGDATGLEAKILATYRLKTAVPAGALARMGAITGGGSETQIEALGAFFEALGLAFQLMDDVLNLRGFKGDLKTRGEDVANGTITLPIAKAMSRLPKNERYAVWQTLSSKSGNATAIDAVIEKLEECGAIQAVSDQACALVEGAWRQASPFLLDSFSKIMFRAFGWYVLERHY